jgi:hypothetical protein
MKTGFGTLVKGVGKLDNAKKFFFRIKVLIVLFAIWLLFWYPIVEAFIVSKYFNTLKRSYSEWFRAQRICSKALKKGERV